MLRYHDNGSGVTMNELLELNGDLDAIDRAVITQRRIEDTAIELLRTKACSTAYVAITQARWIVLYQDKGDA